MKKAETILFSLLLALFTAASAQAETRYIDDTLYAPLRSGEGLGFRIVHKGVKSGTALKLITTSTDSGYSKVRTPSGIVGWLPSRYLVREPSASTKLELLTKEHKSLKQKFSEISKKSGNVLTSNNSLTTENRELAKNNKNLQVELTNIKRIASNAINLDHRNSELRERNEQLKNELEILTSDNLRLNENNERDKMLVGGGLVFLGVLMAMVVPMFRKDKRDSW